jgi:hypothetical protein
MCRKCPPPPARLKKKKPSVIGTADMDGNVCETCVFLILLKALRNQWNCQKFPFCRLVTFNTHGFLSVCSVLCGTFEQFADFAAVLLCCNVSRYWGIRLGRWWSFLLGPSQLIKESSVVIDYFVCLFVFVCIFT